MFTFFLIESQVAKSDCVGPSEIILQHMYESHTDSVK